MNNNKLNFLSQVSPFYLLPRSELEKCAKRVSKSHHYKDMVLFVQNKTLLNYVYIVFEGKLEQYLQEEGEKALLGFLEERDVYGGLSILFNKRISIRTVRCIEDVTFFRLPRDDFLDICTRFDEFTQYFADVFSQKIKHRSYIEYISKSTQSYQDEASPIFLNQNLANIFSRDILSCPQDTTIQEAARLMTSNQRSSILITNPEGEYIGLLTDHDLRKKVVAENYPVQNLVQEISSAPLVTTPADTQVFEAILMMMQHNINHLAVVDETANLIGVATEQDLLLAQGRSPVFLMHEIQEAIHLKEIIHRHAQLPETIKNLLESGAKAIHINNLITTISDAILKKIVEFSLQEMGEPPVSFAFMILGSEGRKEQTLKTDQDNAIVFADVQPAQLAEVQDYFLKLGSMISNQLNAAGYTFCEYEIMASNPKWCQPISQWKQYFTNWIRTAEPEDLLQASIFFDFRLGFGEEELIAKLRRHLHNSLSGWVGYFRHLAENALHFKPPLDFFGNFALISKGEYKNKLDLKSPMRLIVDFARIYALQNKISYTNTLERLEEIMILGALDKQDYEDLEHAYSFLMLTRLQHQVTNITERGIEPDNYIDPKSLTHIEQQALKESLKRIRTAQGKMRMDLAQDIGIT